MIYFWADTHFNHEGILHYCTRPYRNVDEMNASLIETWNATVKKESDEVWFLGDFGFPPRSGAGWRLDEIFWRLRGSKRLVIGNHDERNSQVLKLPWERQERLVTFRQSGGRAELCHYALETWKGAFRGALMLYGHSHGTLRRKIPKRFDVGVDVFPYPISWEELVERASKETFQATDHHEESA